MGRLGAVLGQFFRCWGHEVPCWRCFGQGGPRNAIWGMGSCRAFVGGVALKFFALQALDLARLALFLSRAGAFMWVYLCGCFRGGLLCVFMWVTLSAGAKAGGAIQRPYTHSLGMRVAHKLSPLTP